ncbi:MAG: ROK family protein [Dinoroseobacter sp.]|nr:ROK family protein [Dinoroseobacter sp.]
MSDATQMTAVVADIGGTNTRVALTRGTKVLTDSIRRFRNSEHTDLASVLAQFLTDAGAGTPDAACVAMAGPVRDGVGTLTNLNWTVDRDVVASASGAGEVAVLNDLQAQGFSLGELAAKHLDTVRTGQPSGPNATRLVIGVGTGFNTALVYPSRAGTMVPPSESGHITLPVTSEEELRLLTFLQGTEGEDALEEALSGRGIVKLYAWARHELGATGTALADAHAIMAAVGSDPCATHAAAMFVRLLGRTAANLALVQLPFGGIYFCGGVARAFHPHFGRFGFENAFLDKGRFSEFMRQFPVQIITDDYAALTGSAVHLFERLSLERS